MEESKFERLVAGYEAQGMKRGRAILLAAKRWPSAYNEFRRAGRGFQTLKRSGTPEFFKFRG